eukprot:SAG31_NODE_465_length_15313_cov_10.762390_8_plen_52_part_00
MEAQKEGLSENLLRLYTLNLNLNILLVLQLPMRGGGGGTVPTVLQYLGYQY